ncbi:MAG TPA: DNA topoisomerase IB [Tepidisphaeraceae bacterium]
MTKKHPPNSGHNGQSISNTSQSDGAKSARSAGLRYVSHHGEGIHRQRRGKGFVYTHSRGGTVRNAKTLARIRSLVIPPAWQAVWICPDPRGHIQAIGKDQRGRKQYRYHPEWLKVRNESKYGRLIDFAKALPKIRRHTRHDLRKPGLPREKVLAAVVRLLETTLIRVGNEEYAKSNHSYGLTTMRNRHVDVEGATVHFEFRGKSRVEHAIDLQDRKLAKIIQACQDLPGQELFQFVDADGARHSIGSEDVNGYLQTVTQDEFTAKDFRTWAGTVLTAMALREMEDFDSETQAKKNIVAAIGSVAKRLGNTSAVCRKCYVHPVIFDAYMNGTLLRLLNHHESPKGKPAIRAIRAEENTVMKLLRTAHH